MDNQAHPSQQTGPLPAYQDMIANGSLAADPAQAAAVERLQDLWERLRDYDPEPVPATGGGLLARLMRRRHAEEYVPTGLYLVGAVGRGKSMLMDLFFDAAQVSRKQRIHFHRFMQNVHTRFHAYKKAHPDVADPIPPLADQIAADAALLCFDEFQVNDIADAMILGRLFQALFDRGVVVVTTSNTAPDDLFKGQPGHDAFLPFIALIKQRLELLVMNGERDYRRERMRGLRTWQVPADEMSRLELDKAFRRLTGGSAVETGDPDGDGARTCRSSGLRRGGALRLRQPVQYRAGRRRLSGDRNAFPYVGAGRNPPVVARQLRSGAAVYRAGGHTVRSAGEADRLG